MTEISKRARGTLSRLLNSCLEETEEITRDVLAGGVMGRDIPKDLSPPPDRPWLYLPGQSYHLYHKALDLLSMELALEYLDRADLDKRLWRLVCETAMAEGVLKTVEGNKKRIHDFLQKLARPVVEFEVLLLLDHLRVQEGQVAIRSVLLRRMTPADLRAWGQFRDDTIEDLKDKTFALTIERGTNPRKAINRAKPRVSEGLDILAATLAAHRDISDEELMFGLSEVGFAKNPAGVVEGWSERSHGPMDLKVGPGMAESLSREVVQLVAFFENPRVSEEMKGRLSIGLAQVRRAARSSSLDDKVNFLFSGLEALLQTRDDPRKGEAISARLALLSSEESGRFFDPAMTLALYELRRSATIHGEALDIVHKKEYLDVLIRTTKAIRAFAVIVERENIQSRPALFEWLLKRGKAPNLVDWLKEHDSPYSRKIQEWLGQPSKPGTHL